MADAINNDYLQKILLPRNYKLDSSREQITFWKRVSNKDTRTKFAFTMITVTKHVHSLRLEGINELRLQNEIKAGKIVLEDEDDFFNYFETVFETTLDSTDRFDKILDFFELQLHILEDMPNYREEYKQSLDNIELLVEMANKAELE
jgi:hypothetical protein